MDTLTIRTRASFARRRSGTLAAVAAAAGFALGSFGAYRVLHEPSAPPIILRQAIQSNAETYYNVTPGASGLLVLLRNDGTAPVEVYDVAFSRSTAEPPLYVAPAIVAPGGEVNVFVGIPGACQNPAGLSVAGAENPVRITVNAHRPGYPLQAVPVEISGHMAAVMRSCHISG
jgi:hypothetical protein